MSLPTRERGLKPVDLGVSADLGVVAPYAGAWIETVERLHNAVLQHVAPYAGAWIETV